MAVHFVFPALGRLEIGSLEFTKSAKLAYLMSSGPVRDPVSKKKGRGASSSLFLHTYTTHTREITAKALLCIK